MQTGQNFFDRINKIDRMKPEIGSVDNSLLFSEAIFPSYTILSILLIVSEFAGLQSTIEWWVVAGSEFAFSAAA